MKTTYAIDISIFFNTNIKGTKFETVRGYLRHLLPFALSRPSPFLLNPTIITLNADIPSFALPTQKESSAWLQENRGVLLEQYVQISPLKHDHMLWKWREMLDSKSAGSLRGVKWKMCTLTFMLVSMSYEVKCRTSHGQCWALRFISP